MNAAERLAILRATWTFRICLALAVIDGLQAALDALQAGIPPAVFSALRASFLAITPLLKFLSITPQPVDLAQKYREAFSGDEEGEDE
jgi:hypothetical protein